MDRPEQQVTRRHVLLQVVLSTALVAGSACLCVAAAWLGGRRRNDIAYYLLPLDGVGHPGVVGVSTSIALAIVAVAAVLTSQAVAEGRRQHEWLGGACLFAALAGDQILRLHGRFGAVEYVGRPLLWLLLVLFVRRIWRSAPVVVGGMWMIAGVALLAISEIIDFSPNGDDPSHAHFEWSSVLEESTLSVGAWCLAAGTLGTTVVILRGVAQRALAAPDRELLDQH